MVSQSSAAESSEFGTPECLQRSSHSAWFTKPLCCRYVLAEFKTLALPVQRDGVVEQPRWRWALGLFKGDQYELLGAWSAQVPALSVAQELHDRGIEHIKAISAEDGVDCTSTYPDAVAWSASGDAHAASTFGPRRRAALQSAAATAERLQASLSRAIKRQAPFADEGAAAAFLMHALENADRQLHGLPKLRFKTALRRSGAVGALASQPAA
ncbi:hypothetical protein [Roseateles sp. LYH14W]|uniref:Uncharacterized protein n=1 Tax=Pelomonas parva TaxID=3299032 RepID=A0ABW7F2A9_9BURK